MPVGCASRPTFVRLLATVLATGLAAGLASPPSAPAIEIVVTSTSGGTGGSLCTLRDAITAANSDTAAGGCPAGSGADTIILTAGATYTLTEVDNTGVNNPLTTLSVTPGATPTISAAAPSRFVDNGDGTVTDTQTGLMWEQKTGTVDPYGAGVDCSTTTCSDPHDVNDHYAWSASGTAPDGAAFTDFLARVNGTLCSPSPCAGLGGHSDWRLPTIWELHALVDSNPTASGCSYGNVCIDQAFGPTAWNGYWSATIYADNPAWAWGVWFYEGGGAGATVKTDNSNYVRAVRGTTQAPAITVTSTSGASGPGCALCDAITAAKTDLSVGGCPPGGGADTIIVIAGARYTLPQLNEMWAACTGIPQSNGLPSVTSDITIIGNGATVARSAAPGTPAFRLLHVAPSGHLTIHDLTLTNGKMPDMDLTQPRPGGDGGGTLNEGVLTLINASVIANSAGNTTASDGASNPLAGCAGRGGAVFNAGTLTLTGSNVSGNAAGSDDGGWGKCVGDGGGIYNDRAAALTLEGSVVSGNTAGYAGEGTGGAGGGIFNAGSVVVVGSSIRSNAAGEADNDNGGNGGGIANADGGTLQAIDTTISNNGGGDGESNGGDGGGIFNSGTVMLTRCTVGGNSSGYGGEGGSSGGGIANAANGILTLVDSTVSGNQASGDVYSGDGGGIFNTGNILLASCTISGNSAGDAGYGEPNGKGGGIATTGPVAVLKNTLIANNSIGGDCDGVFTSQGSNLIHDVSNCTVSGDVITGLDPCLGPLQDNGGATETQALLPGSPAIDAGDPSGCTDADGNVLTTDQRGAPRAVRRDTRCDIGAYETTWQAWPTITPTPTPTLTSTPANSPTATATPTWTSTLTPTSTATFVVAVDIGSATGQPGQQVTVQVFLHTGTYSVAGVQNDIGVDADSLVVTNSSGKSPCRVNPDIHKSGAFAPSACSPLWPGSCWDVRALIFSFDDLSPIPDGALLYTCTFTISPDATLGSHTLINSGAVASDPNGNRLSAGGHDGAVVVVPEQLPASPAGLSQSATGASGAPSATATAVPKALAAEQVDPVTGGSGCNIGDPAQPHGLLLLLAPLVFLRRVRQRLRPKILIRCGSSRAAHPSISRFVRVLGLILLATAVVPGRASAAIVTPREVLGTGTTVPRFGRIGTGGFTLLGLADDGRALLAGSLDDGRTGLFWADGAAVTPLWLSGGPDATPLDAWSARLSSGGKVVALSRSPDDWWTQSLYVVGNDSLVRVVSTRETDAGGNLFCSFDAATRINDAGTVAFQAEVAVPGTTCFGNTDSISAAAIYLANGATIQRVTQNWTAPALWGAFQIWLLGLTSDGTTIFSATDPESAALRTMAAKDGQLRTLVANGTRSPSGQRLFYTPLVYGSATANDAGEIVFTASEENIPGIYRTQNGAIIKVVSSDMPAPDGLRLANLWDGNGNPPALDTAGNVVLRASWEVQSDQGTPNWVDGILLYPATGASEVIIAGGPDTHFGARYAWSHDFALNNTGQVGLTVGTFGGSASLLALRWRGGVFTRVLGSDDSAVGSSVFAQGGLDGPKCLAADGRLATTAYATAGSTGLLCGDAAGFHLVAQSDDPAPEGGNFSDFGPCTFAGTDQLIFSASKPVPQPNDASVNTLEAAVYRAAPDRIERLVGAGDTTADGSILQPFYSSINFAANSLGHVVVYGATANKEGLFLRRSGPPEFISLPFYAGTFALTDADDIALLFRDVQDGGLNPTVLEMWSNGEVRTVAQSGDMAADGIPYGPFSDKLLARGNAILFAASGGGPYDGRVFVYSPGDAAPRLVFAAGDPTVAGSFISSNVIDFTPASSLLFAAWVSAGSGQPASYEYFLDDGHNGPTEIVSGDAGIDPFALNASGAIGFMSYSFPAGSYRYSLQLSGPGPTAANCPIPPTALPAPQPTPTTRSWNATQTPAWTPTTEPAFQVTLTASAATGAPGADVTFALSVKTAGYAVAGTQNDIDFDPHTPIAANAAGTPQCVVDPDLNKTAAFAFLPHGCTPGADCTTIRALVLSMTDTNPIADGAMLYRCHIQIASSAVPGTYPLTIAGIVVSSPIGVSLPVTGTNGAVTVVTSAAPQVLPAMRADPPGTSTSGCAIGDPGNSRDTVLVLAPIFLLWTRRFWLRKARAPRLRDLRR